MNRDCHELKGFLDGIHANPRDVTLRGVFADWLDDHDEPELASEQREFDLKLYDAEQWLRSFANQYAGGDYKRMVEAAAQGEIYCFSDDNGPWRARQDDFWENLEIVQKKQFGREHRENPRFLCSC